VPETTSDERTWSFFVKSCITFHSCVLDHDPLVPFSENLWPKPEERMFVLVSFTSSSIDSAWIKRDHISAKILNEMGNEQHHSR